MALRKYLLLVVVSTTISFVENAPSSIKNISPRDEELRTRLVFIDRDADKAITDNSQTLADAMSLPTVQQTKEAGLTRSKHYAKSVDNVPSLKVKALESTSISNMDDERRIWGIAVENKDVVEDESYYNRPLSLPKHVVKIPSQAKTRVVSEVLKVTEAPQPAASRPSTCDMAIVICCASPSRLKECFRSQGCLSVTEDMFSDLCSNDSLQRVIKDLGTYYKGNQEK